MKKIYLIERNTATSGSNAGVWDYDSIDWHRTQLPLGETNLCSSLKSIEGSSENNIWVGGQESINLNPYIAQFDGFLWKHIPIALLPAEVRIAGNSVDDILVVSPNEVYFLFERSSGLFDYIVKFNGTTYDLITGNLSSSGPYGGRCNLARRSNGDIYTVLFGGFYRPYAYYYNGTSWTQQLIVDVISTHWYSITTDISGNVFVRTNMPHPTSPYNRIIKGSEASWANVFTPSKTKTGITHIQPPYKTMDSVGNNIYHITTKLGANGIFVWYDADQDQWTERAIPEYELNGNMCSISDTEHWATMYNAVVRFNKQDGSSYDKIQPTGQSVSQQYSAVWGIEYGLLPPYIKNQDPINETIEIYDKPVKFSIKDDEFQVSQSTVMAYIKGELVYSLATGFTSGWSDGSLIIANASNGFDLTIQPDSNNSWHNGTIIVRAVATNIRSLTVDDDWSFEVIVISFDIWQFLIQSIRDLDRNYGDLLIWRWLRGPQIEWENAYNRIKSLNKLNDPKLTPTEALQYLKWIVGLTSKLDFLTGELSEENLRILITIATRMWKYKGTPRGLIETIEAMSAEQVRFLDWFFFRTIVGEMEIGHAELDVDIWLLDQPGMQTSIYPDGLIVTKALDMQVLPSAADPLWSYISVNGGVEGTIFNISSEKLNHVQTTSNAVGGFYKIEDLGLNPLDIQMGAVWIPQTITAVTARPWFIKIIDGIRAYKLSWSDVEIAVEDEIGNVIAGPRSHRFVAGESYRMRIAKIGSNIVASVNDNDLFGNIDSTLFYAVAFSGYEFGFGNNENQNWIVKWDDVGPTPILNFDISSLLGLTEAVPHAVRVKYTLKNIVRTVYSYWDGSKNRCNVIDAFGLDIPILTSSLNDFKVGVDPDEFVSDLKVVDDGDLDRNMIENLVKVLRPAGERIYIRYMAFQDKFRRAGNWVVVSGTVTEDFDDGELTVNAASVIRTDMNLDSNWKNITARAQVKMTNVPGDYWEMRFNYVDELNFYAVGMNPADIERSVFLDRVVAGARTNLDDYNFINNFLPDVYYNLMVQTEWNSTTTLMKVFLDGNYLFEASDTNIEKGRVAISTDGTQIVTLSLIEVAICPYEFSRIGPPPDGPPLNNNVCII